jgi:Rrf2 family protein
MMSLFVRAAVGVHCGPAGRDVGLPESRRPIRRQDDPDVFNQCRACGVLTQTVEYALRAAVYLADESRRPSGNEPADRRPVPLTELSAATDVPAPYLAKVLRGLARAGLVRTRRGTGGGYVLARAAGELTILDVVDAVDPIERITRCPLGLPAHAVNLCKLHALLDRAIADTRAAFAAVTLAELVADPSARSPLCRLPADPVAADPA